jgi:hypothetical protein
MRPVQDKPILYDMYNWCFVLSVLLMFLLVMLMSSGQGFGHLDTNFYQKNILIEYVNRLQMKLGDRVFPVVLLGDDGWMEYTGEHNLDDFQNVVGFSSEGLQVAAQRIGDCHQYADEHGITFLIVVAPNKASIYPDKMPAEIRPLTELSRFDQLNNRLRNDGIPEILDLRIALRDAREQQEVYYKTDTHWNGYGAYISYREIIDALSQSYPALEAYPAKYFRFREKGPDILDLSSLIQANFILEPRIVSTKNVNDIVHRMRFPDVYGFHGISGISNSDLPSLLLFHDSFGYTELNNLLAVNFGKVLYIHRAASQSYLNKQAIEEFAPDIIIFQIAERYLGAIGTDLAGCASK